MTEEYAGIGARVAELRGKRKLSTAEVATTTGLSEEVVRGIEAGKIDPPLGQVISLADALQVTVGELLGDNADSSFCIVRGDSRKTVSRFGSTETAGGYSYESLGQRKMNRHMEPFLVTLSPGAPGRGVSNQHPGEEMLFVLTGAVEVKLADHADILYPGDSIYYDSTLPHVVSCHGGEPATLLAVIYARKEMMIL